MDIGDFDVETYEYEAPDDMDVDEEIDSDAAFDSEDEAKYGHLFQGKSKEKEPLTASTRKAQKTAKRVSGLDLLDENDGQEEDIVTLLSLA